MDKNFCVWILDWTNRISIVSISISILTLVFAIVFTKKQIQINNMQNNLVLIEFYKSHYLKYRSTIEGVVNYFFNYIPCEKQNNAQLLQSYNSIAKLGNVMNELVVTAKLLDFDVGIIGAIEKKNKLIGDFAQNLFYFKEFVNFNQSKTTIKDKIFTKEDLIKLDASLKQSFTDSSLHYEESLYTQQIRSLLQK